MEFIEKNFKHSDCGKLNEELDNLISDLSFHSEGLSDNFMDIILDHSNQKEKEWEELYETPLDWFESILIKTQKDILEGVIDKLEDIVYTEKPNTKRMNAQEAMNWLIDDVRPLILDGTTKRKDIAKIFKISEKTVRHRVIKAYGCNWKEYVHNVQIKRF